MMLTVPSLFRRAAERHPHRVAVQEAGGGAGASVSYADLETRAETFAQRIRAQGLVAGDRVVLVATNSVDYLAVVLGSAMAGTAVVPVSTYLTASELEWIIGNSQAKLVIASPDLVELARQAVAGCDPQPTVTTVEAGDKLPYPETLRGQWTPPKPSDLLYLGYTSGTTGHPKGVSVSHANRVRAIYLQAVEFGMTDSDTHLVVSPLYHTAPLTFALLHLCLGGTVRLRWTFEAEAVARDFIDGSFDTCFLAPAALQRVLEHLPSPAEVAPRVRSVIIGGSPCPVSVKTEAVERLPGRLWEFYGATEVGVVSTLRPNEQTYRPRSAGRLLAGTEVGVRDPETQEPCPAGEVGEVWIRTLTQTDGYFGHDKRAGDWSFLGDVGFLDDEGFLHLVDRSADIIISGGVNVYSREIETVLESHPDVVDVAVFGIPDPRWGEIVVAAVCLSGETSDTESLLDFCSGRLAAYKHPRLITAVDALPRGATGKINKRELRERFHPEATAPGGQRQSIRKP